MDKASHYYSKTENPWRLLLGIGTSLNPYLKLVLYRDWDETEGFQDNDPGWFTQIYRQQFIDYYEKHYAPPLLESLLAHCEG